MPFEIDPRPFQAPLDQAKAQLAQAQAQVLYQNGGASYLQVLTNETNSFLGRTQSRAGTTE